MQVQLPGVIQKGICPGGHVVFITLWAIAGDTKPNKKGNKRSSFIWLNSIYTGIAR